MKKCTICKLEKNTTDFNKNKGKKDGLNNICRECSRDRSKKYYNQNNEHHKKATLERSKKYKLHVREFIIDVLKNSKCVDCGIDDVRVLEFDHLPKYEKKFNISDSFSLLPSIDRLKKEINKCEVVCANCHRIRTIERSEKHYKKTL